MSKTAFNSYKVRGRVALGGIILAVSGTLIFLPLSAATVLVIGAVFGALALARPEYALYALVFAIPFGSVQTMQIAGANVGAMEALFALLIAAWLARMVARREIHVELTPLLLPLLIFYGAISLSLLNALSLKYSLKELIKWLEFIGVYLFVVNNVDRRRVNLLVVLLLLAGIAEALLGFYQFFGRVGPEWFMLWGRFMRAYGTFEQPNPYAGYLGLILPVAYGIFSQRWLSKMPRRAAPQNIIWLSAGVAMVLIGAALLMSWSRGAWLGFMTAFAAMNVVQSRRALLIFSLVALGAAVVLLLGSLDLLPAAVVQRFTDFLPYIGMVDVRGVPVTTANYAVIERLAHWYAAQQMFAAAPWLGVGIGNYEPVYAGYALPGWDEPLGHAHNYYLNIAAEAGLVGLTAYILLWGAVFWLAWRAIRRNEGYWRGIAVGIFGVLVHLAAHNFFDNLYVHGMYLHVAILVGVLYCIDVTGKTRMKKLLIATNNQGKIREYAEIFADLPVELTYLRQEGIELDVAETGQTFTENAVLKAQTYAQLSGLLTLADDSGLEVDALGGAPGVFSARYAGEGADDTARYHLLLRNLVHVPDGERQARFRCVVALALPDGEIYTTEGICEGEIARAPRGDNGFGYDPVFYMAERGKTMAELPAEVKNRISHRGRAAARAREILLKLVGGED